LRERQIPYVDVNEAKKSLFAGSKLGSFHFVAYQKQGLNWLIWAAAVRRGVREDMKSWEQVFGDGFIAVLARRKADQSIEFKTLDGKAIELQ
jgi:hypothetical protein